MSDGSAVSHETSALAPVARSAILWGGAFTLFRDVLQFATMLVLVRLLSQEDYGRVALAQTVLGLFSVVSFKTFVAHALQSRDPAAVDWQAHFTAAAVLNSALFALTLVGAGLLYLTNLYVGAALPLAALSFVFLIEIPSNLRTSMLQVAHEWRRLQVLTIIGVLIGSLAAIAIAAWGGGIWALIIPVLLLGLPAGFDLFIFAKWRPDLSWSWARYRSTARFGAARTSSATLNGARQTAEQMVLAGVYDFSALGVFTRSIGLATLVVGRIGTLVVSSLYPVLTRANPRSDQFRRMTNLVLRIVVWTTIPAASFLAFSAADTVALLYGSRWNEVTSLLPLAAAQVAFVGVGATAYTLLLANNETRACLAIDAMSAGLGVVLVFWLIPLGPRVYLLALVVHGFIVLSVALAVLRITRGIDLAAISAAIGPPIAATVAAISVVIGLHAALPPIDILVLRLGFDGIVFSTSFVAVLCVGFSGLLSELLEVLPSGWHFKRLLLLTKF